MVPLYKVKTLICRVGLNVPYIISQTIPYGVEWNQYSVDHAFATEAESATQNAPCVAAAGGNVCVEF